MSQRKPEDGARILFGIRHSGFQTATKQQVIDEITKESRRLRTLEEEAAILRRKAEEASSAVAQTQMRILSLTSILATGPFGNKS